MGRIRDGVRRLTQGGLLLRDLRGIRRELARIADALEDYNAHQWPQTIQADPSVPSVEVSYVDTNYQAELMDIETRLTAARGQPPTEEEILQEYIRRYPDRDTGAGA